MAVESNGRLPEPGQKGMNGHAIAPRSKTATKKKGFSLFSIISRLLTWYSIITILFRCPSTVDLLTESSPKICKPYFQLRSAVTPHLEPYYDAYAAPYVNAAKPYYETLDKRIITPATALGQKYGAPRVAQAQAFGQAQWEKTLQPQVEKYQGIVKGKYDETLAPHVGKVVAATSPYYEIAKANTFQTYYGHILPTYNAVQPYALQGYGVVSDFTVNTVVPSSKWAWATGVVFVERTVWPKVRILYGENVEPQLVRIGERLGRYRDGKKIKAVVEEVDSSSSASFASQTFSSISSSIASAHSTPSPSTVISASSTASIEIAESTPASEKEVRENAQKVVANDLKTWQEKFAKAADEGSDDLEERITEVTDRLIKSQAEGVGKALTVQLEETVKSNLKSLKSSIISIVKSSKDTEESEEAITNAVRKAGVAIKEKAQAVRTWRQSFDRETNSLVSKSASDTFEILDHIRDLGLQEIGMRWAWIDGVTHKDWAKYHKLKGKFDEWRIDVEKVVEEHPGLGNARTASELVENHAMAIAEDAAKELARIKETGRWKLSAEDTSDDWTTKYMPAAAVVAGQKILDKVKEASEAIAPSSQGTVESVVSVASSSVAEAVSIAQSGASSISSSVIGTPQGSVESVISVGSASASSLADQASSSIIGTQQGSVESVASIAKQSASSLVDQASNSVIGTSQGSVESIASVAKESASSIADQASSSVIGTSQGTVESVVSVASESASSLSAQVSSSVVGEEPGIAEKATKSVKSAASVVSDSASSLSDAASSSISSGGSVVSNAASEISSSLSSATSSIGSSLSKSVTEGSSSASSAGSSASSSASKKVWGGAMAQVVEARQIIYDDIVEDSDDESYSEKIQSMASEAGDKYADLTKAVSEALLKPSSTEGHQITSLASQQYSSALAAASSVLYGTEQGTGESIASAASSRYADAVSAASSIIYGTPIPITDYVASQASGVYSSAVSMASENYEKARSLVSAQISGEPVPAHEALFSSAQSVYSDSVAAANSNLQAAVSAASTAIYGAPPGALESMSSLAQARLQEGLSAASSRYSDAKSYVAAINTGAPQKQKMSVQIQEQYYAGIGMAHARYSEFLEAASSAVMPKPITFHESLYSKASEGIVGTPTNSYEAAMSTAKSQYQKNKDIASSHFSELLESITNIKGPQADAIPTPSLVSIASAEFGSQLASATSSWQSFSSVVAEKIKSQASHASVGVYGSETPIYESVASAASAGIYGSETPLYESVASAASENWEALITKASSQIYAQTTPYFVTRRLLSEAKEYGASATEAAVSQYAVVQSIISELVVGKEPDFTESIYNKLSSAYYTGANEAASSASSYASEAYASASSVVTGIFTPPPALEEILASASSRVNDVMDAASLQVYGSSTGYAEAASSSIADAALSAQKAISEAIYGTETETGTFESATSVVSDAYQTVQAKVSRAWYGEEKGAVESAQARIGEAVESARLKLAEYAAGAGEGASEVVRKASEGVEEFASSVGSVVEKATGSVKDEL